MGHRGGNIGAEDLAGRAEDDVHHAGEDDGPVREDLEVQVSAGEDEEEHHQGRSPAVHALHQLLGEVAQVAEHRAQGHAHQQVGEAHGHRADLEVHLGQRHSQHHEGDGDVQTLGAGMEELLAPVEGQAQRSAQTQGGNHLHNGVHQHADHIHAALLQGAGDAEGNSEDHQAHHVVQGDDGQQRAGQGAVRLVLLDDHQRGGRGSGGGDGAQGQHGGEGQLIGHEQMQAVEGHIHEEGGDQRLEHGDDHRLAAHLLQGGEAELIAHGEGDEAQRHVADDVHLLDLAEGGEAQALNAQTAQAEGADQDAGHQIGGDGGQIQLLGDTGHHQTREQCNRKGKQQFHIFDLLGQRRPALLLM